MVEDHLLQVGLDLLHLAQDDAALALDLLFAERAVLQYVGQDVHRLGQVLAERLGVVDRLLSGRVGVQVRAHVLHLELQVRLASLLCALK